MNKGIFTKKSISLLFDVLRMRLQTVFPIQVIFSDETMTEVCPARSRRVWRPVSGPTTSRHLEMRTAAIQSKGCCGAACPAEAWVLGSWFVEHRTQKDTWMSSLIICCLKLQFGIHLETGLFNKMELAAIHP